MTRKLFWPFGSNYSPASVLSNLGFAHLDAAISPRSFLTLTKLFQLRRPEWGKWVKRNCQGHIYISDEERSELRLAASVRGHSVPDWSSLSVLWSVAMTSFGNLQIPRNWRRTTKRQRAQMQCTTHWKGSVLDRLLNQIITNVFCVDLHDCCQLARIAFKFPVLLQLRKCCPLIHWSIQFVVVSYFCQNYLDRRWINVLKGQNLNVDEKDKFLIFWFCSLTDGKLTIHPLWRFRRGNWQIVCIYYCS